MSGARSYMVKVLRVGEAELSMCINTPEIARKFGTRLLSGSLGRRLIAANDPDVAGPGEGDYEG